MPVVFMRVDDRLIHGQITCAWLSFVNASKIYVVGDQLANDPITAIGIKYSKISGIDSYLFTVKDALENLRKFESDKIMVIVKDPETALSLVESGIKIDWLDVGQIGYKDGRKQVAQTVSVNEEEAKTFIKIKKAGVDVIYRQLPDHSPSDFIETLKNHFGNLEV